MNFVTLFAGILAVWRVTHLFVVEDGPWHIFTRFRRVVVLRCFLCTSVWVAVPFALLIANGWRELVIAIPALSAGAAIIDRVTVRTNPT
ncbi:MAG TPA: hypothetical protein VJZ00_16345 [Thermoanaerobaculia bacterium]|nr:hypothetical protein [Thermoanaerobaculia bacterium]